MRNQTPDQHLTARTPDDARRASFGTRLKARRPAIEYLNGTKAHRQWLLLALTGDEEIWR
jgi:hypothetical protein